MQKLSLHYEKELKGKFNLKKLNFLFIFQVNCPGCFLYGIPMVNQLFSEFSDHISFLGLSTAFEDFEYNTKEHAEQLILQGTVVGETKKAMAQEGYTNYPNSIDFPIAMDKKTNASFDYHAGAETICKTQRDYLNWSEADQKKAKNNVVAFLKKQKEISLTFTLNQMRGTPTMLLFNDQYEILFSKFGHSSYDHLKNDVEKALNKIN